MGRVGSAANFIATIEGKEAPLNTPDQAVKKVLAVASEIPQMTVLGIAGPGDSLANPKKTFDTMRMLHEQAPDIKLCLSTNGLMLPDYVEQIVVDYTGTPLTISFNAQYVLDFLNVVETDVVSLSLKDDVSQAVMKPVGADAYDYTYVIMPMRI